MTPPRLPAWGRLSLGCPAPTRWDGGSPSRPTRSPAATSPPSPWRSSPRRDPAGAGWNVTASATVFTASSLALPTTAFSTNGSITSATSTTGPTAARSGAGAFDLARALTLQVDPSNSARSREPPHSKGFTNIGWTERKAELYQLTTECYYKST